MADGESILGLLRVLYAAPSEPWLWTKFLRQLCAACGVSKATIIVHDLARKDHRILACQGNEIETSGHLYESHYWQFDEWTCGFARREAGRVVQGEEVWPQPIFLKSAFYNEFLRESNICELVGIRFRGAPGVFESISLYRGPGEDPMGSAQISALEMIAPHLENALATRRRLLALEGRVADMESALDSLSSAVVLVSSAGNAVFVNRKASDVLARGNGLFLHKSRLTAASPRQTAALQELIDKVTMTSSGATSAGGGTMALPRCGRRPLHILVSPVAPGAHRRPGRIAAAVFLDDPELQPLIAVEVLRTLFGLTEAEAGLAVSILDCHSVSEAAEQRRVSRETAKSQMTAIFSKTGTRRQGELIRLLSRLPCPPA